MISAAAALDHDTSTSELLLQDVFKFPCDTKTEYSIWNSNMYFEWTLSFTQAFQDGFSVDKIHDLTSIDKWFLHKLDKIKDIDDELGEFNA